MAYNSSFPIGYQQYYPTQYQQQNIPQTQTAHNSIIWVQGEAGAKSYLVAPNTTVQLWDSESQTIYLKSADASGMPTMKILDYTIREQTQSVQNVPTLMQDSNTEYVTKDEFFAFSEQVKRQIDKINGRNNRQGEKSNGKQTFSANEQ